MTIRITTRRRAPRRGIVVRAARAAHCHETVRRASRPTQRQLEAIDALAVHAIADYEAGRTIGMRDYAAKHGLMLDLG